MKLCIVNPFQHGGGAEYQIACLLDVLLPQRRFEVFYLAHHVSPQHDRPGCTVVKIGAGNHMPRFGYITDAVPLYAALRRIRPDVIYQRVAGGYTGVCAYYTRRQRVRGIWHVAHESDVMPGVSLDDGNPVRRWLEKRSVEYGARHAGSIVTQTHRQAELLAANYGRRAAAVIPNFQPAPRELGDKSGPPVVLWVANFKRWKRPEVFMRLAAALRDLSQVRFVMVGAAASGSGDREWGAGLLELARAAGNVELRGSLPQDEVNALLASARLLVNTSTAEGFSNTFIQAWMRATPVVSLDVDPDDILERERVGVHAGSEARLADAVRRLLTDDTLRAEYARRARDYALAHHSLANADRLIALLEGSLPDAA